MTFVYNYTRSGLLAVSLWHLTFNRVSMIATDAVVTATMSTVMMVLAVVVRYGGRDLSPYPGSTAQRGKTGRNTRTPLPIGPSTNTLISHFSLP